MTIGGLQKVSLTDYPDRLSAVIFTQGCNFRCPYCHNPELVEPHLYRDPIPEDDVVAFLESRLGRLKGVVVTGGEPTIHHDLLRLLRRIRRLGLFIKLDTNGSAPHALEQLIAERLLDYVAVDIKSSVDSYSRATGVFVRTEDIRESVEMVISSGLRHELRMTFLESFVPLDELRSVADLARGCGLFLVQPFEPSKTLDPRLLKLPRPSLEKLERVRRILQASGLPAMLR
ncbi:MAG TPA: anaerobic ribonucleoside-triphosphate reductase activating protein [Spirochaetia bacterium]|nr:anaerobic ribonucleoside-triphosphate reductase activating protein [Spirochaetia bacterium]